jgi:hypothetical protein
MQSLSAQKYKAAKVPSCASFEILLRKSRLHRDKSATMLIDLFKTNPAVLRWHLENKVFQTIK